MLYYITSIITAFCDSFERCPVVVFILASLPEVHIEEETEKMTVDLEKRTTLSMTSRPISLTTAVFDE